ncbi:MAG: formylmethanofuran dehydrogenase subunit E family protein [Candidatus Bathyarchaeota archaeon]|nr:MAG: formylmethanofuran dehydrogenase subunit E family protein [Candidatus Bathyarchaeota archaeon]
MSKQEQPMELNTILKRAIEFHGHFGPFLVIGVRMGLIGLRELKSEKDSKKLRVTASLKYSVPFSCILDGIQVTTGCTLGNQRLTLKDAPDISAEFQLPNKNRVTITVNQNAFKKLKKELQIEGIPDLKIQELAHTITSMPETDLFLVERE